MDQRSFRLAAATWAASLVVVTIIRGSKLGQHLKTSGTEHVLAHIGVFAVLGALLTLGFRSQTARVVYLSLALILGFATESYEHLVYGNVMEYADVALDAAGVLAGAVVALAIRSRRPTGT